MLRKTEARLRKSRCWRTVSLCQSQHFRKKIDSSWLSSAISYWAQVTMA